MWCAESRSTLPPTATGNRQLPEWLSAPAALYSPFPCECVRPSSYQAIACTSLWAYGLGTSALLHWWKFWILCRNSHILKILLIWNHEESLFLPGLIRAHLKVTRKVSAIVLLVLTQNPTSVWRRAPRLAVVLSTWRSPLMKTLST